MKVSNWIRPVLAVGAALGSLAGCSSTRQTQPVAEEPGAWEVRMESPLDTVEVSVASDGQETTLDEPAVPILETPVVTESAPAATGGAVAAASTANTPPAPPAPASPPGGAQAFTPGWRVQLFASSSMVSADALAVRARRQFSEAVYVVYEPPLYKVRLGDFLSKEDARHMANRAKAENFEAWVVEDMVLRPTR